jgi:hypothetical protein
MLKSKALAFIAALMLLPGLALAQTTGIDVSATTTELGLVKDAVIAIGVAVLSIVVGIKLYKWIKRAL